MPEQHLHLGLVDSRLNRLMLMKLPCDAVREAVRGQMSVSSPEVTCRGPNLVVGTFEDGIVSKAIQFEGGLIGLALLHGERSESVWISHKIAEGQ